MSEKETVECNTCKEQTLITFYEPYYSNGVLIGERVKYWCNKCDHEVRSERRTIIKEIR